MTMYPDKCFSLLVLHKINDNHYCLNWCHIIWNRGEKRQLLFNAAVYMHKHVLNKIQQKHSCQLQSTCLQIVSRLSWHLSLFPLLPILYFFHPQQAPAKSGQESLARSTSTSKLASSRSRGRPGLKKQGKQLLSNKTRSHPLPST